MNTRLRKNLIGSMSFYSHIPCRMREYAITHDEWLDRQLLALHRLFDELNDKMEHSDRQVIDDLITRESRDSWLLTSDKPGTSFSIMYSPDYNENEENIRRATAYAEDALSELPLSSRLFCNIHYMICGSSAYDKKYRGEYRTSPVWIGRQGCGISDAAFIPPVGEDMTEAIADLERFIHYNDYDVFVKAAMTHYQFEMIHPFIDANGRVGRIINTLFLYETGVLQKPTLLFSQAISESVGDYYNAIQHVNLTLDMDSWIRYFLSKLECGVEYTIHHITARND